MEWQPIETAPKDGKAILGFADGKQATVGWASDWESSVGSWDLCVVGTWAVDGEWSPTHWMPLPEPPDTHRTEPTQ